MLTLVVASVQPLPQSAAEQLDAYLDTNAQSFSASRSVALGEVKRDVYSSSPGIQSLVAGGTNHDWARAVLLFGGWPMSEANVTVITRWMRQENGPNSWYNRNNPLNSGGGGLGTYPSLLASAQSVATNLQKNPGYSEIVAAFAASAPTEVTENAIWYSPWATGHYADGAHWHYTPVPEVKAPAEAWG